MTRGGSVVWTGLTRVGFTTSRVTESDPSAEDRHSTVNLRGDITGKPIQAISRHRLAIWVRGSLQSLDLAVLPHRDALPRGWVSWKRDDGLELQLVDRVLTFNLAGQ